MKGMIFTEFLEMVEQSYGLDTVEKIIETAAPESGGAYTSVGNYHHAELLRLANALAQSQEAELDALLRLFGEWVFLKLFVAHYADFFAGPNNVFEFLSGVESYVHVEVRKLYPEAELPSFQTWRESEDHLVMVYRSARPFAAFAHGLICGCVIHYGEKVDVSMRDISEGRGTDAQFDLIRVIKTT